jgi:hypothetical protein
MQEFGRVVPCLRCRSITKFTNRQASNDKSFDVRLKQTGQPYHAAILRDLREWQVLQSYGACPGGGEAGYR